MTTELTIDELGRRDRHDRAQHPRAPVARAAAAAEVRGRTGYYGPEHVARLELIQELQAEGFNLELIKRLLEGAGGSSSEVLRFKHALARPFGRRGAARPSASPSSIARVGHRRSGAAHEGAARARRSCASCPTAASSCRSPRLASRRPGAAAARRAARALAGVHSPACASRPTASPQTYVDLFLETVWTPFEQAGRPRERWPDVQEALERLHPLAAESLLAIFGMAMKRRRRARVRRGAEADGGDRPTPNSRAVMELPHAPRRAPGPAAADGRRPRCARGAAGRARRARVVGARSRSPRR